LPSIVTTTFPPVAATEIACCPLGSVSDHGELVTAAGVGLESVVVAGAEDVVAASVDVAPAVVVAAPPVVSPAGAVVAAVVDVESPDDVVVVVVASVPPVVDALESVPVDVAAAAVLFEPEPDDVVVVVGDGVDESVVVVAAGVEVDVSVVVLGDGEGAAAGAVYCDPVAAGCAPEVGLAAPAALGSVGAVDVAGDVAVDVAVGSATGMPIESDTVGTFANGSLGVFELDAVAAI
jgi:hypothetical protein